MRIGTLYFVFFSFLVSIEQKEKAFLNNEIIEIELVLMKLIHSPK